VHPDAFVTLYEIVAVPTLTLVTDPVLEFTVATDVLPLLHTFVTSVVASLSTVNEPIHKFSVPDIADTVGNAFTDTVTAAEVAEVLVKRQPTTQL
jgi:hypothetical protein